MKIVFTANSVADNFWDTLVEARFGRADYLVILDEDTQEFEVIDNTENRNHEHGAGPKTSQKIIDAGAKVIITGNGPGGNAKVVLDKVGVKTYVDASGMSIKEAYEAYKNGNLKEF